MKIQTKIKGLLAILIAFFMFSSMVTKAQAPCPKIQNQTHCSFKIQVTLYKKNPQTGLCNVICNIYTTVVPPGASIPVQCNCAACNISIQVLDINGMPIAPVTVDYTTGPKPLPANPCGASTFMYNSGLPAFIFM